MKQNIVMVVLRKANPHSVDLQRLIKINNVNKDQEEKLIQTLIFPKVKSAPEILRKKNVTQCISWNSFYTKEPDKVEPLLAIYESESQIGNPGRLARLIIL